MLLFTLLNEVRCKAYELVEFLFQTEPDSASGESTYSWGYDEVDDDYDENEKAAKWENPH